MKGLSNWGSPRNPANMFFGLAGVAIYWYAYYKLHYQSEEKHLFVSLLPAAAFYLLVNLLFMRKK